MYSAWGHRVLGATLLDDQDSSSCSCCRVGPTSCTCQPGKLSLRSHWDPKCNRELLPRAKGRVLPKHSSVGRAWEDGWG